MTSTEQSCTQSAAINWRPVIAQGIAVWVAIAVALGFLPSSHPATIGIALSMVLGAPLLPISLWADLRQTRNASECPPTTGEYLENVCCDMIDSVSNRTALGAQRAMLYDCSPRTRSSVR